MVVGCSELPQTEGLQQRKLRTDFENHIPRRNEGLREIQASDILTRPSQKKTTFPASGGGVHALEQRALISFTFPAEATSSLSRLTSRSRSICASLSLILLRPTTSTSMAPLLEPRRTFSIVPSSTRGCSTYLDVKASKNGRPNEMEADGRMNEPEVGCLWPQPEFLSCGHGQSMQWQ